MFFMCSWKRIVSIQKQKPQAPQQRCWGFVYTFFNNRAKTDIDDWFAVPSFSACFWYIFQKNWETLYNRVLHLIYTDNIDFLINWKSWVVNYSLELFDFRCICQVLNQTLKSNWMCKKRMVSDTQKWILNLPKSVK